MRVCLLDHGPDPRRTLVWRCPRCPVYAPESKSLEAKLEIFGREHMQVTHHFGGRRLWDVGGTVATALALTLGACGGDLGTSSPARSESGVGRGPLPRLMVAYVHATEGAIERIVIKSLTCSRRSLRGRTAARCRVAVEPRDSAVAGCTVRYTITHRGRRTVVEEMGRDCLL